MQAQADLAQLPVDVYPSPHATALGAAACARLALDPALDRRRTPSAAWTAAATYRAATGPPTGPPSILARWHALRNRFWHRRSQRLHERHRSMYDVVVVGAGIVGLRDRPRARRHHLSVALLEARDDVGDGTSKANTAILHTGFDATPGTLESRLVARGYDLLGDYAAADGIPVERTGALLVAWTDEQLEALPGLQDKAERNGYHALRDRRCRRGLPPGARPRPRRAGRPDGARRVDHLHLDHQPGPRHRRGQPRRHTAARRTGSTGVGRRRRTHHAAHHPRRGHGRWVVNAAGPGRR